LKIAHQLDDILRKGIDVGVEIAPQGACGELIGARCATDAQVDAVGMERGQCTELLRHHQRRMVRQHDATGGRPGWWRCRRPHGQITTAVAALAMAAIHRHDDANGKACVSSRRRLRRVQDQGGAQTCRGTGDEARETPRVDVALNAQKQLRKGVGILKVAKTLGLATGTVQKIKQVTGTT